MIDNHRLAAELYEQGVLPERPRVACGRTVFWEDFHPERPTTHIVTDGTMTKILAPVEDTVMGVIEYRVTNATYVLVVGPDEESLQLVVTRCYFTKSITVRDAELEEHLISFCSPHITPADIEQLFAQFFARP